MPKIKYQNQTFQAASLRLIETANRVIEEYTAQGFVLTLRQLYYQLVARDYFPDDRRWRWTGTKWVRDAHGTKNALPNYKWLGALVNDARLAGLIDWNAIEDRTRNLRSLSHWTTPQEIVATCAAQYMVDMWATQKYRPEVWIEKDALVGVIEGVCEEFDTPFFSCRGYTSQSEMWGAAMRLRRYRKGAQTPVIFHLGDHDPSGKDMTRDIIDRLELFMGGVKLERLALNMDQVEQYNPPPNPAKTTDSRYAGYIAEFGDESWELDALEPAVIADLIRTAIAALIDDRLWAVQKAKVKREREMLEKVADHWTAIIKRL